MKFKIDLPIENTPVLDYKYPVLTIGSCFADRIANKLKDSNFNVVSNPFGTLYNPISMAQNLQNLEVGLVPFEHNGMWHSFLHHSDLSRTSQADLEQKIAHTNQIVGNHFNQAKAVNFVTFGSASVFTYNEEIVANCHKLPAAQFQNRMLTVDETVNAWSTILSRYPNHDFIFTVSPVRYTREGMHQSNLSKSVLHLAVNELVSTHQNAIYFPAYEIVIDELRDYRFYAEDLVHPNDLAVTYVWEKVREHLMTSNSKEMLSAFENLSRMEAHNILHPDSDETHKFLSKLKQVQIDFETKYGRLPTD